MGSFALKGYFFAGCSHESCDNCIVLGGVDNIVTEDRKLIVGKDKIHCFVLAENRYNALIKWLDLKLRQVGKLYCTALSALSTAFPLRPNLSIRRIISRSARRAFVFSVSTSPSL